MPETIARRTIYDQFMVALGDGYCPEEMAELLGLPIATVSLWLSRLGNLASDFAASADAPPPQAATPDTLPSLTLVYTPDVLEACAGQVVTFTANILNDDVETLLETSLLPGRPLEATTEVGAVIFAAITSPFDMGDLPAGGMSSISFSHKVSEHEARSGGELVSRLSVRATSTGSNAEVTDQCCARVKLSSGGYIRAAG
ncbi:hypothetical protein [Arthrobacter sp. fls2-241-R2A-172]|uniref:hypothetical protein n=1 Tax=Arthrobacter sp. fls2-241-R2A-172 TaxID=3040325 RepID=UPI00254D7CE4|nr:hypothetical protein [Arthrobacter sp. fls2-241-R2A-172]